MLHIDLHRKSIQFKRIQKATEKRRYSFPLGLVSNTNFTCRSIRILRKLQHCIWSRKRNKKKKKNTIGDWKKLLICVRHDAISYQWMRSICSKNTFKIITTNLTSKANRCNKSTTTYWLKIQVDVCRFIITINKSKILKRWKIKLELNQFVSFQTHHTTHTVGLEMCIPIPPRSREVKR